jgi:ribosome biogenesis GTPase
MAVLRGRLAAYPARVSVETAGWTPRLVVSRPVGDRTGRVVSVDVGVVEVVSRRRTFRATVGAALLQQMAQDRSSAPRVGDRVRLRFWADGPVTVERVVARAVQPPAVPDEDPPG